MTFRKKNILILLISAIFITIIPLVYSYYEARNIRLIKLTFTHKDIPEGFVGKKIIFISDIHCDRYFTSEDVAKLVNRINEREPDIIIIGGDIVSKNPRYLLPFFVEIKNLKSKYGTYFVLGNHDHWEDPVLISQQMTECGFHSCDNQSYWIKVGNDSIKIGGVGDFWEDVQIIGNTTDDVKIHDFCILISHNPDYLEVLDSDHVDLMLSGHTHGGQITFFGLWAPIMPSTGHPEYMQTGNKYRYGWLKKNNISLYVTSGIGMGGFPFRFFAPPEIVEITLKK
ncbi:metallophosphoesterase [Dysgonomonas sp. ZJ709]|uniref:metallophosphoesterase n=1 Tax=Dysgonomonas sp. ZJ709 TaxID=2709797 RepID=UPI0013EB3BE6|nr:metallophosphoesterase [Dysgonomonas sp. ZJ709]